MVCYHNLLAKRCVAVISVLKNKITLLAANCLHFTTGSWEVLLSVCRLCASLMAVILETRRACWGSCMRFYTFLLQFVFIYVFLLFSDNKLIRIERSGVYPEEIVFVSIIVLVWIIAVFVFLKQWNSIRILEPIEPRYKHAPKNLENIRIVKRTQDSVIYKGYSRKLSITMVEREKRRLQRMNTAPVLPVTGRMTLNTLPTIHMEDMTTEM